ncbi:class I SAM-dependent methyltransferase [Azospirillum halopraeferens]|uniref:class I SAM-dependent methyltransferase n=1 Tax=Azospirillum halopraeferens TaxID=34010 RepID=UPI00041AA3F4|nr:methyltransferase domain-containing protein [Azospirillum halopraeferens]
MKACDSAAPGAAAAWVVRFAGLVAPEGSVLDLACGGGRHLRLFRDRGHPVTGVDRDLGGVADLTGAPGVELIRADLEDGSPWPLAGRRFAGIVVTNYLHRPLFGPLIDALAPGGVLLYETFAAGNERFGKPSNPAFLLHPGELAEAVRGHLQVVAFEQGVTARPRPAVVQRLAAVAADGPVALDG